MRRAWLLCVWMVFGIWSAGSAYAEPPQLLNIRPPAERVKKKRVIKDLVGIELYDRLLRETRSPKPSPLFQALRQEAVTTPKPTGEKRTFVGNLRILQSGKTELILAREQDGKLHVLALPKDKAALKKGAASPYAAIHELAQHKLQVTGTLSFVDLEGTRFSVLQLTAPPQRQMLDRLFFLLIIALLFFTMVGMGLTLTGEDFARIAQQPRGMIVGPICQFGLLPLCAFAVGHLFGFATAYPFIFVGMLLVTASPGGVTSNLMTYFAKGDVALSISLTAFSTVFSLVLTPLLMALYAAGVPEIKLPVGTVIVQIFVLVILPLGIGMLVRAKAESFALRSEKFFSVLGMFSLLFLVVVGVLSNLDKFADTERYGLRFYLSVSLLPLLGMLFGGLLAKLLGVGNSQVRAISLETGLQNSSLAMTLAILLQDRMGDFYSSMFFTSGIFGLSMYVSGALAIALFPMLLPLDEAPQTKA